MSHQGRNVDVAGSFRNPSNRSSVHPGNFDDYSMGDSNYNMSGMMPDSMVDFTRKDDVVVVPGQPGPQVLPSYVERVNSGRGSGRGSGKNV